MCYSALGQLITSVIERLTFEIYELDDITELESHRLGELLNLEDLLENILDFNTSYCAGIGHFKTLLQLLTWSFASIMDHFRMGALMDFEIDTLCKLIRALFSDTPLRERNLKEIRLGHPI